MQKCQLLAELIEIVQYAAGRKNANSGEHSVFLRGIRIIIGSTPRLV
jgi:hypothetical protein